MNINGKCGCGAAIELASRPHTHYGGADSFSDGRIMEVFYTWNKAHEGCSAVMAEAQRPTFKFPLPTPWPPEGTLVSGSEVQMAPEQVAQCSPTVSEIAQVNSEK